MHPMLIRGKIYYRKDYVLEWFTPQERKVGKVAENS